MDRWEYGIVNLSGNEVEDQKTLNEAGAAGWELVSVESQRAYFKRSSNPFIDVTLTKEWPGIAKWD